jgi:hypothetical protein
MLYIVIMYETFLKFTLLSNSAILSFSLFQGNITKQFSVYYKYNTDDVILVFDATGKPTPSILNGALNWPGDYDECLAVRLPIILAKHTTRSRVNIVQFPFIQR